jgi:uncharacterized protein YbjT (DUF2867 family)
MKILITGANGHLGRRLIDAVLDDVDVIAVVRSEAAKHTLRSQFGDRVTVAVVDYGDAGGLSRWLVDCDYAVHLVGIIKESSTSSFAMAHEAPATALVAAADEAGIRGIVHLSILGSGANSGNACLRSRGLAEDILRAASTPVRIIQVPMVLGEGDYAARALTGQARRRFAFTFRKESLEQPIYAGDVIAALRGSIRSGFEAGTLQWAGPESLTRELLIHRAGALLGTRPHVVSLPLTAGLVLAAVLERQRNPPLTRAMLGVLDHDDRIDVAASSRQLGLSLTPLDDMLRRVLCS